MRTEKLTVHATRSLSSTVPGPQVQTLRCSLSQVGGLHPCPVRASRATGQRRPGHCTPGRGGHLWQGGLWPCAGPSVRWAPVCDGRADLGHTRPGPTFRTVALAALPGSCPSWGPCRFVGLPRAHAPQPQPQPGAAGRRLTLGPPRQGMRPPQQQGVLVRGVRSPCSPCPSGNRRFKTTVLSSAWTRL